MGIYSFRLNLLFLSLSEAIFSKHFYFLIFSGISSCFSQAVSFGNYKLMIRKVKICEKFFDEFPLFKSLGNGESSWIPFKGHLTPLDGWVLPPRFRTTGISSRPELQSRNWGNPLRVSGWPQGRFDLKASKNQNRKTFLNPLSRVRQFKLTVCELALRPMSIFFQFVISLVR